MIDPATWTTVDSICGRALEMPADARSDFVRSRCDGDDALERHVRELLAAIDTDDDFLEPPDQERLGSTLEPDEPALARGTRLGPWEILRPLGSGGMGRVYLARRSDSTYEQLVAIKVLRGMLNTPKLRERFLRERQTLARLNHPCITTLLDGGTTPGGAPYLVMEYVDGEPLVDWATRRSLSIPERIRLLLEVCAAVEHAHASLVVHRDLKPSNVIVDADGRPRLLDFGIARLLDPGEGGGASHATGATERTPAYASPEQIRGEAISTATDVHGLGGLLYELLTARNAWAGDGRPIYELERRICEDAPPPPSTVALPATNRRSLRGDLDAITARALVADPAERYASAAQLAEDLQRHLDHRPIRAVREGVRRRCGKFMRRHRVLVAAGCVAFIALVVAVAAVTEGIRRDRAATLAALQARDEARLSIDVLQSVLQSLDPLHAGDDPPLSLVLEEARRRIDALPSGERRVRARLHRMLADTYSSMSRWDEASRHARAAVSDHRRLGSDVDPIELAASLISAAGVDTERAWGAGAGNRNAVASAREALALRQERLGPDDPLIAEAMVSLATALWVDDSSPERIRQATALQQDALAMLGRCGALQTTLAGDAWSGLAYLHQLQQRVDDAENAYRQAVAAHGAAPEARARSRHLAQLGLGDIAWARGDRPGARAQWSAVLAELPIAARTWRHARLAWFIAALEFELGSSEQARGAVIAAGRTEAALRRRRDDTDPGSTAFDGLADRVEAATAQDWRAQAVLHPDAPMRSAPTDRVVAEVLGLLASSGSAPAGRETETNDVTDETAAQDHD